MKFNCFFSYLFIALVLGLVLGFGPGLGSGFGPSLVEAQVEVANRPISEIRVTGLKKVKLNLVLNQLRSAKGAAYSQDVVKEDIRRLTHLGRFKSVEVKVTPLNDNTLILTFVVIEQSLLNDVRVVGNKRFSDQQILGWKSDTGWDSGMVVLRQGEAADAFLIDRGRHRIEEAYQKAGFFKVAVTVDKNALETKGILIYKVVEGGLVKISKISFQGNTVFSDKELNGQIKSETAIFIFRKGHLSKDVVDNDVARLRDYYRNRGYLDAEVGGVPELSPDGKNANIIFLIHEGPVYTVASIKVEGNKIFSDKQIVQAMDLKVGDVFAQNKVRRSQAALLRLYQKLGHIDMRLRRVDGRPGLDRIFHEKLHKVDVIARIHEARPHFVGKIEVRGNETTKDRVVLRAIRGMEPGRRFDGTGIERTKQRLRESPLFDVADVTVLGGADDRTRDVLIDVKETPNPGSLSFGAALSSDVGVLGAIDLVQRNFDWQDWPDDISEIFSGKAFRGAGQYFQLTLQPGDERSLYSVGFREPYMFDSRVFLELNARYYNRDRVDWDEERAGGSFSIGQVFGDVWRAQITPRFERVNIQDVEPDAPVDAFAAAGGNDITGIGISVVRDTTDSRIFPTRGNRWETGIERVGAIGGDFDFTKLSSEFKQFWKVEEDFFGRATVLTFKAQIGVIFEEDEAPLFERFYAGGHRSFRGFEHRGVGPRGIRMDTMAAGDDPVGGDFLFLMGLEYNRPIYQDVFRGVVFIDAGTVQDDFGLDEFRVSIGMGVRLKLPLFGQAPFAFDIAVPLKKEDGDETQYFSFDVALPF